MGFPDRIERTVELAAPPERVWPALTTADGIAAWFSDEATIDLRPGGTMALRWTGENPHEPTMRVERVEPHTTFGFSWPQGDQTSTDSLPRTYVEFTLEPNGGGTRLTVVESGFAQLPESSYRGTFDGHTEGWQRELDELVAHVGARAA